MSSVVHFTEVEPTVDVVTRRSNSVGKQLLPSGLAWGFEWGIYSRNVRAYVCTYVSVTLRNVNLRSRRGTHTSRALTRENTGCLHSSYVTEFIRHGTHTSRALTRENTGCLHSSYVTEFIRHGTHTSCALTHKNTGCLAMEDKEERHFLTMEDG